MPLIPKSSYYDKNNRQSASLIRARRPYLVKNAVVGVCLSAFAVSVFAFTMRAVSQDDFEDVEVPPAPTKSGS